MKNLFQRPWTRAGKRRALRKMDLRPIRTLLQRKKGWTEEQLDLVEALYRDFLELMIDYPEQVFSPSKEVDEFWHMHLLDSQKYEDDCNQIFGRTIHHDPHLVIGSVEQREAWENTCSKLEPVTAALPDCAQAATPDSSPASHSPDSTAHHGSSCGSSSSGDGSSSSGSSCGSSSGSSSSCGSSCGGSSSCGGGGGD